MKHNTGQKFGRINIVKKLADRGWRMKTKTSVLIQSKKTVTQDGGLIKNGEHPGGY